ncbi:U8 snoRNA-decapping enzyme-like isoform X2 [Hippocampus comes]|uniref:U8 snoRNA-decapping enzyme n=2 Tax=Hippocampus comes TaxID=109280 RepID=A0A3Q2XPG7_HIPCM|nr:PREDICTED: U8 snoRNA-decapping enzyme-like isoform X2 [Hippocampus comes]XP_019718546.1 PREDICTED: U8 snoRNA-decapping enzyme-like isoform X2 [Hippocampus comes]XP_019748675.1 PREDICTED: U8 snoRNA-decapping enzyme-like isoform X2 [Hippocampus comes]XP_019748676.1 PREDICTED: U8 snoRNA-decapping enzyme-like isoform X2 [Hippocampus comes]
MANGQLSRAEALAFSGYRHACHVMLYSDTKSLLFGRTPIKHVILMQMRFDGLLGFPGGFVNQSQESLEAGLCRELQEELGVALSISEDDHVDARHAPRTAPCSPRLITHFYVKKLTEEQIKEVEQASASTARDHGQEVLGMVRVPLYTTKNGGGLSSFLSHAFIGNARTQLLDSLLRLRLLAPEDLHKALKHSMKTHAHSAGDLQAALALTAAKRDQS